MTRNGYAVVYRYPSQELAEMRHEEALEQGRGNPSVMPWPIPDETIVAVGVHFERERIFSWLQDRDLNLARSFAMDFGMETGGT